MGRNRKAEQPRITLRTWMVLIAVLGLSLAVTRSWCGPEWSLAFHVVALTAVYWAIDSASQ